MLQSMLGSLGTSGFGSGGAINGGPIGPVSRTLVSFTSVSLEVAEARLPSAIFCTPLRAACTIWSWVRERLSINRSQKMTVPS